jgi:type VI secretion system secreted protein Hcp
MKTKCITIALVAITSISSHLVAQDVVSTSERADLHKNIRCVVSPTDTGFAFTFQYAPKASDDGTVSQSASKKGYDYYRAMSAYRVSTLDNSVTKVISPRDAASGMPSGKRQHKPLVLSTKIDKSTPVLYEQASTVASSKESTALRSSGGAGKVNMNDIHFTKVCGGKTKKYTAFNGESIIPTADCPDGACNLKITWTWNDGTLLTDSGASVTRKGDNSAEFVLKIKDGVCTAVSVNEKGASGKRPR